MVDPDMQYKPLLAIAKLYIQTGDYEVARKMFETLRLNPNFIFKLHFYQNRKIEEPRPLVLLLVPKKSNKKLSKLDTYRKY